MESIAVASSGWGELFKMPDYVLTLSLLSVPPSLRGCFACHLILLPSS